MARDNKTHYDLKYGELDVSKVVSRLRDVDAFLADATSSYTSWVAMYHGGLAERVSGKRVLEVGSGEGTNALVLAGLGATVVATDISEETPRLIGQAAEELGLADRVTTRSGDFCGMELDGKFDLIVGKAVLHHFTYEQEDAALAATARLLDPAGEARFVEPAENSRLLDGLRWATPVPGRPSKLMRRRFAAWRATDPHPERVNTTGHFRQVASRYFSAVEFAPFGALGRFDRLVGRHGRKWARFSFRVERHIPDRVHLPIARTQLIVLRRPIHPVS